MTRFHFIGRTITGVSSGCGQSNLKNVENVLWLPVFTTDNPGDQGSRARIMNSIEMEWNGARSTNRVSTQSRNQVRQAR